MSPCANPPALTCILDCGAAGGNVVGAVPVCDSEGWYCPEGSTNVDDCAPESCVGADPLCCDPMTGVMTPRACGNDGLALACAPGSSTEKMTVCSPAADGLTSCARAYGTPCSEAGDECWSTESCFTRCTCQEETNGLVWDCVSSACTR
jgi:hypothetical protein